MKYGRSILVAALVGAASAAQAGGIGVRAGTTGLGADFGWDMAPTLGGRIGLSAMNFNTDFETSQVNYDAKVKLANLNLFLDWSPLGPFRITGGFIANNNKIDLNGQPTSRHRGGRQPDRHGRSPTRASRRTSAWATATCGPRASTSTSTSASCSRARLR